MIVLATKNRHKVGELAALLKGIAWRDIDPAWTVKEGSEGLIANAMLKATSARRFAGGEDVTLGEDTGLFVRALKGAPGVLSARWAGETVSFEQNIKKLLSEMSGFQKSDRQAAFITAACLNFPDGKVAAACGRLEGEILEEPRGQGGFGYDAVFFYPPLKKTLAELTEEEKNSISHRARAMDCLLPYLKNITMEV